MLVALSMVMLLGATALSVDVGRLWQTRRAVQNASDAAALAGAGVLLDTSSQAQAQSAAQSYAAMNAQGSSAQVNIPPATGPNQGNASCVEVITSEPLQATFARVLGFSTWNVDARSVACIVDVPKPYAIIAMNASECETIELEGNTRINIDGAGIFDNSECSRIDEAAFDAEGNVQVTSAINSVVGSWSITGNSTVSPTPTHAPHITDPLADLPPPTPPSGPARSCPGLISSGSVTLQPGVYDGCQITIDGNANVTFAAGDYYVSGGIQIQGTAQVTFGAGIYSLDGVGFRVSGDAQVSGDGVTFYLSSSEHDECLEFKGNGRLHLTAPSSGPYAKILVFANRNGNCDEMEVEGNATWDTGGTWGTIYGPTAELELEGNVQMSNPTSFQYIVNTLEAEGNTVVNIKWNGNVLAQVPSVKLAE